MLVCLGYVSGVYVVQVSFPLIGQQGLVHFFRYRPLLSIGWRIEQIFTLTPGGKLPINVGDPDPEDPHDFGPPASRIWI